jgi:hypothetical protein
MLKTTIIHLTVNSTGRDIGGVLVHTTPATPAHRKVLEAMSFAFASALEKEGAVAMAGLHEATLGDRAAMATRLNLLIKRTNPKPYNDAVLDCINSLKN